MIEHYSCLTDLVTAIEKAEGRILVVVPVQEYVKHIRNDVSVVPRGRMDHWTVASKDVQVISQRAIKYGKHRGMRVDHIMSWGCFDLPEEELLPCLIE